MRHRAMLAGVVGIALGSTAVAFAASSRQYNGTAESGANAGVEFGTKLTDNRPVKVRRFGWFNIPAQCQGSSPTATSDKLTKLTMKVNSHRRFSGEATFNGGRATAKVNGRFARGFGKATGTLRLRGTITGCATADTGKVKWEAPAVSH